MKKSFKLVLISLGVFSTACSTSDIPEVIPEEKISVFEKLYNSFNDYSYFAVEGNATIKIDNVDPIYLPVNGNIYKKTLADYDASADFTVNFNNEVSNGFLSYIDDFLTLNIDDIYFKSPRTDLETFIDMTKDALDEGLPTKIKINKAENKKDFKQTLLDLITNVLGACNYLQEEQKTIDDDGAYYFPITIYEQNAKLITTETDEDLISGVRLENFVYEMVTLNMDVSLERVEYSEDFITNPLEGENKEKYLNFSDTFSIFNDIYDVFETRQLMAKLTSDIGCFDGEDEKSIVSAGLNLGFNLDDQSLYFDGTLVDDEENDCSFLAYREDETIYAKLNNLSLSLKEGSLFEVINYIQNKVTESKKAIKLVNKVSSILEDQDLSNLITEIKSILNSLTVHDKVFEFDINLDKLNNNLKQTHVVVTTSDTNIESIHIDRLIAGEFFFDNINLVLDTFEPKEINKEEFVSVDPCLGILDSIDDLIESRNLALNIKGSIGANSINKKNITLDADVQLDFDNDIYYGDINITDKKDTIHNVKIDYDGDDHLLANYNDGLKAKFNTSVLKDLDEELNGGEQQEEPIIEPIETGDDEDDNSLEEIGDLLSGLNKILNFDDSPIINHIVNGDYFKLLNYDLINNLQVNENELSFDVKKEIIDLGTDSIHLGVKYSNEENFKIDSISLTGIKINKSYLSFEVELKEYDFTKDAERLVDDGTYLDFTRIKDVVAFVKTTISYKYLEITGKLTVSIPQLLGITLAININIKLRFSENGFELAVELTNIPVIPEVNPGHSTSKLDFLGASSRTASLYWSLSTERIYVYRVDKFVFGDTCYEWMMCDQDFFIDNFTYIFVAQILAIKDKYYEDMGIEKPSVQQDPGTSGGGESSDEPDDDDDKIIHYENILSSYKFSESDDDETFAFGINLNEIIQREIFSKPLNISFTCDKNTKLFSKIEGATSITAIVEIKLNLNFELTKAEPELTDDNFLSAFYNFLEQYHPEQYGINWIIRKQSGNIKVLGY